MSTLTLNCGTRRQLAANKPRQTGGSHVICNYECDEFRVAVANYNFHGGGAFLPSQCCFHFRRFNAFAVDLGYPVLAVENDENSKNSRRA